MQDELLDRIEAYLDRHCGMDGPTARIVVREVAEGGFLPMALTTEGASIRADLLAALDAAREPKRAPGEPAASASGMSADARQAAFRAVAGPDLVSMADAMAAAAIDDDAALAALQRARAEAEAAHHASPTFPTVEERAGPAEGFGADFSPMPGNRRDERAASWRAAMERAERAGAVKVRV